MGRKKCCRRVSCPPPAAVYKPAGVSCREAEAVELTLDEFEALRLADADGLYQEEASVKMKVSRPTFTRILMSARRKTAGAIINGKILKIGGGSVKVKCSKPGCQNPCCKKSGKETSHSCCESSKIKE